MPRRPDPSDLTDAQWLRLEALVLPPKPGGRPPAHPRRELIDAMLDVLRNGVVWRALPHEYPPWQTVSHYFRLWRDDGTFAAMNAVLRTQVRVQAGRAPQPSAAIIDSQSVKTTEKGGSGAMMGAKRSTAASGTSWSTRLACC